MEILCQLKNDLVFIDICEMIDSEELGDIEELGCHVLSADENDRLYELNNG